MGSKISRDKEEEICREYKKDGSYKRTAKKFEINWKTVRDVVKRVEARNNSETTAPKDIIRHDCGNQIFSSENGTTSVGLNVPNMTTPISTSFEEDSLFAKYLELRELGKSSIACAVALKLGYENAKKMDENYMHLKNLDKAFDVARMLNDEHIDCELLIKEVNGKGSIRNYLQKLAEMNVDIEHAKDFLAELQCQCETLIQNKDDLNKISLSLITSIDTLTTKKKKLELDIEQKTRILTRLSLQHEQSMASFRFACEETQSKITRGARKLIEKFMKNDNPKLEALLVSLIWALRENPTVLFELCNNRGSISPYEAPALIDKCRRELAIAGYFCKTVLHQAVIEAAAEDAIDPKVFNKAEPHPPSISNSPKRMAVPSRIDLSETLDSTIQQPWITYQPSPLDTYARVQTAHHQQQNPPAALAAPDNRPPILLPEHPSPSPAPASGTCNSGQCTVDRTKQRG